MARYIEVQHRVAGAVELERGALPAGSHSVAISVMLEQADLPRQVDVLLAGDVEHVAERAGDEAQRRTSAAATARSCRTCASARRTRTRNSSSEPGERQRAAGQRARREHAQRAHEVVAAMALLAPAGGALARRNTSSTEALWEQRDRKRPQRAHRQRQPARDLGNEVRLATISSGNCAAAVLMLLPAARRAGKRRCRLTPRSASRSAERAATRRRPAVQQCVATNNPSATPARWASASESAPGEQGAGGDLRARDARGLGDARC